MAHSMTSHLEALKADDLEVLLQRRPEARRLLPRRRQDFATLAEALSAPQGIHLAAMSLNAFLIHLLQLGLWLGPDAPAAILTEHAEGVAVEDLRAGAEELARWGLAFIEEWGSQPAGSGKAAGPGKAGPGKAAGLGWVLAIPASTVAAISMPPGFGPLLRRLYDGRSNEFLVAVARNLSLPARPHSGKASMIAEIAAALCEPARLVDLLQQATPQALDLFDRIRTAGGSLSRHEMMVGNLIRWSDPAWTERRKVLTPLDWLESRGLVVLDASTVYTGSMVIPGEVELALRGGKLFERWPPAAPPELAIATTGGAEHSDPGDPFKIVAEMETLLEAWSQSRPVTLQKGGIGIREIRKTAKALGFPERYVGFLYALAAQAGLVGVDDEGRVMPSPVGIAWTTQPAAQRWATLFQTWLECTMWGEVTEEGLVPLDEARPALWIDRLRPGVVEELATLPPGAVTDATALGGRLAWRYPALLGAAENAEHLARRAVQALMWLGTASGPHPIHLLEPGRSAIADPAWFTGTGPGAAAFAPEVATCTVGADLTVIVPGPPVHELGAALGRFAELKASSPARIYQLSETSLRRALDGGMQAAEITAVLERYASRGVPQNVTYLVEDVGRRHGHLVAGATGLYLRSDDPSLLRGAIADRRLASYRPRLIAPTVAVLDGTEVAPLLTALRSAGYLPVAEDGGGLIRGRAPIPEVRSMLQHEGFPERLSPEEAAELARTLRSTPPPAPAAPKPSRPAGPPKKVPTVARSRLQVRDLMDAAIEDSAVVEISYVSANGRRTTRSIEPIDIDGSHVEAWCRLREDERRFALARIEWARLTGEVTGEVTRAAEPRILPLPRTLDDEEVTLDRR